MDGPRRSGPAERAAGQRSWRPSWVYLVLAFAIVASGLVYAWIALPSATPVVATAAALPAATEARPAPAVQASAAASVASAVPSPPLAANAASAAPQIARMRDPDGDQTPDLSDYVNAGEQPTMG